VAELRADAPWETLLDFDALSAEEGKNWVYKGVTAAAARANASRCLLSLSDGGKDAVRVREYSTSAGRGEGVRGGGFVIAGSQAGARLTWQDKDTLLIATDWGGDTPTLTERLSFDGEALKRGSRWRRPSN
jgi:prolyl oligopeptidase